jgi:hypothetical protein
MGGDLLLISLRDASWICNLNLKELLESEQRH